MNLTKYRFKELKWEKVVTPADKKANKLGASVYTLISKKIKLLPDIQYYISVTQGGKFLYTWDGRIYRRFKTLEAATKKCQEMYEKKLIKGLFENV